MQETIPYHDRENEYTPNEAQQILNFMNSDEFPKIVLNESQRNKGCFVEIPKISEDLQREFIRIINLILPEEIASCHPLLQRRKIVVRFVDSLKKENGEITTHGDCLEMKIDDETVYYIRISLNHFIEDLSSENLVASLIGVIIHEIAEIDYYLKSDKNLVDMKPGDVAEYHLLEDEEIANKRTLRALKKVYPNVHFSDISYDD